MSAGDTLERVIAEMTAMMVTGDDAVILTDGVVIIYFAGILAVCTVAIDLFAKQHGRTAFLHSGVIIHAFCAEFQSSIPGKGEKIRQRRETRPTMRETLRAGAG